MTYTCPFCGGLLLAMTEHVLLAPEGEVARRRHAHTHCVRAARARGELPTFDEWRATQSCRRGLVSRLLRRSR